MKHLKLFFALFAMLALGVTNAWAEEYALYSGTITEGDYVIVYDGNAMNNTVSSSRLGYTAVTITGDKISNPDATIVWHIAPSGDYWTIFSANVNKYAASTGAKNKAQLLDSGTDNKSLWTVSGSSTYEFVNKANDTASVNKNLRQNGTYGFACYATSTGGALSLYKKVEQSGGGETPEPEPDPTPDPGTGGEETWTLVTNESDLKVGDQIVIAATESDDALGPQATNNRTAVAITKTGNNITWTTDVQIITLEAGNKANTFAFNTGSGYLYAASSSSNNLKTKIALDDNGSWTISITSAGIATIKAQGTYTRNWIRKNSSSAIFSCYASGQKDVAIYKKVTSSGVDEPETPTPSVSVDPTSHTFATTNVGETATQEFTITAENTTATLSASIDNTIDFAISAITGDKVTVTYQPQSAGDHTATMTVKAGEEASTTVALTGKAVAALEGTWILVTDASSLKAGDEIIIASKDENYALSKTQNSNNRGQVEITKTDNTITATTEAQVLTLQAGKTEGTLALYTGAGYLHAASSSVNHLKTETELSDNSSWTIAVEADGTATLTAQGTYTRNTLCYNKSNKLFACYASTNLQQPIVIYKNTNGQQLAGLAYATTKYLTKLGDAFTTPTLTNPNSLTVTYSSSDNNVATVDNTGTVTIKAAGVVVITAAFAGDASYLEGSAKYTLCVTEHAGTEADPYSVADARRVIDVMETAEGVYATGIVSEIVTAYNSEYGNITYNISIDGTTVADQLQAYRGKGVNGEKFSSANDIKVGDEVVIKGNLKLHNGTLYEFDADNQLVSLKRDKQQASLAYEEKEHTANVGEDFTEPTLSNPYSLSITYSSSNTTLATVNATTGEVSILAAGKVTITASSAADATYAAGSASYNITITDPSLAVATLPFAFNGNKAAIETTAGMTQNGLGSDYSASTAPNSQLKFDGTGDWVVIRFDSEPEKLSYDIKNNSFSGGKFSVQESADGETYTDVAVHTTITDLQSEEYELNSASRYVKFIYTTKSSGNVGLGNISITKADHRQDAGLVWNPATVSLTVGDAFTAPTFSNPNSLAGITFTSDNEALATVNNAGAITLVSGKTGTATITATFADGHATYKPAEATCVITVSPKSEKVVILAEYNGQWYALKAAYLSGKTDRLDAVPVNYVGGKLYNVAETDKEAIEWNSIVEGTKVSFLHDGKYLKGKTSTTLLFEAGEDGLYQWDNTNYTMTIGTTVRSFLYNGEAFRNFAVSNAGKVVNDVLYSSLPVVTAPVYATGDAYGRSTTAGKFGTICLPFGSTNYTGATFYEFVGSETGKVYLGSVTTLEAGVPYIFEASAAEVAVYGDGTTAATPGNSKGLHGTFTDETTVDAGNYILLNNELRPSDGSAKVNANRAYIVMSEVPTGVPTQMPGRRYIGMSVQGENEATGFENVVAPEGQAIKVIENGQLIIIRGGEKFNVQGQVIR